MLSRKQLWRKCKIINYKENTDNEFKFVKYVPIKNKIKKKVRFSNIVYLTLIPTKDELNKLLSLYELEHNHKISNKIATIP